MRVILTTLLPEETSAHVHDMCAGISVRMALEKADRWFNTHVTQGRYRHEYMVTVGVSVLWE